MKPDQNWFNGVEFFQDRGVPISSYPLSLEDLDKYLSSSRPPSGAEGANDSKNHGH